MRVWVYTIILILIVLLAAPAYCEGGNIIKNPGCEEVSNGVPVNWSSSAYKQAGAEFVAEEGKAHSGAKCYTIINKEPNDSKIIQEVNVQAGKVYKVSCWIRTENVKQQAGSANITLLHGSGIYTSQEFSDTNNNWANLEFYIRTVKNGGDKLSIVLRLGGQGTLNQGKASFDDVDMELVENPDSNLKINSFYIPGSSGSASAGSNEGNNSGTSSPGSNKTILYIIIGLFVITLIVFIEMKFSKNGSQNNEEEDNEYKEDNQDNEDA